MGFASRGKSRGAVREFSVGLVAQIYPTEIETFSKPSPIERVDLYSWRAMRISSSLE